MKELLNDWHDWLPLAGVAVVVLVGLVLWLRRTPESETDIERQRRAYLNRVGRIVEGQVLEIVEHARDANDPAAKPHGMFQKRAAPSPNPRVKRPRASPLPRGEGEDIQTHQTQSWQQLLLVLSS